MPTPACLCRLISLSRTAFRRSRISLVFAGSRNRSTPARRVLRHHVPRADLPLVLSVDAVADSSADATLLTPPESALFRTRRGDHLFTDPVLLDGAGQLIGFWAWDRFQTGFTIFPFGFEALQLFGSFERGARIASATEPSGSS